MGRILIVDDSSTVRLKLSRAAETLGHESRAVADGSEALSAMRDMAFDAVLLDIVMPGMDGFEVLAAAKSDPRTRDIPVIIVSGLSDTMSSVVKAMELGAADFLPKSFELPLLKGRLLACMDRNLARQAAAEVSIRAATLDDIPMLVSMINTAGAGIPLQSWRRACSNGQNPWDKGRELMLDERADIYYGNSWIAQTPSGGLGGLVLYLAPKVNASDDTSGCFKPIKELEDEAAGTAHVSYLCTIDTWRGQGIGSALLRFSESRRGPKGMSVIVAGSNSGARALYRRFGYVEQSRRPMVMPDGRTGSDAWILMLKA
jgi:CheY-like chemotaxis protein